MSCSPRSSSSRAPTFPAESPAATRKASFLLTRGSGTGQYFGRRESMGSTPMAPPDCQNAKSYKNWSETVKFTPARYCEPTTEQRVIDIVTEAGQATKRVRTVGAGHSFSQLVATPDTLLSLHELKTPAPTFNGNRATVPAGMSLKDLIQTLKQHSPPLALKN